MSATFKYTAFISYSHVDRKKANWLHSALESYRIPSPLVGTPGRDGPIQPRLFPIFLDRDELPSGPDVSTSIREALEASGYLIVLCSCSSARSRWVDQEIELFKQMGRADRLHAAIIDGDPGKDPDDGGCFPHGLRPSYADRSSEPLAADLRPDGDGRSDGTVKLVAGILGIPLDTLRRRDRVAQRRRLWQAGIAASLVACLGLAVAVMFWKHSRDQVEIENQHIPAWRIETHATTLDLRPWKETTEEDLRLNRKKSQAISTDRYTVVKTQDYETPFVHVVGTSSDILPDIFGCNFLCRPEKKNQDKASHAPHEMTITFTMPKIDVGQSTVVQYSISYWNAFQSPEQMWGGFRVLEPTEDAVYSVIFPSGKHPRPDTLHYYFHDEQDHELTDEPNVTLDLDPSGRVKSLLWECRNPTTDRSYRVRWNWDAR